jgi:hypothetical protein
MGLDVSCVRIKPHKIGEQVVIVPTKIIPLQEAKQYLIDIQQKEELQEKKAGKRQRTMKILIENNLLKEGDKIYLKNSIPKFMKFEKDNPYYSATITGKLGQNDAIKWDFDSKEYSISYLTWILFKDNHPEKKDPGGVNGNWNWVDATGRSLWDIAETFLNKLD